MIELGYLPPAVNIKRMDYQVFNRKNTPSRSNKQPAVTIRKKTAHGLTVAAAELLGLKEKDGIAFAKDTASGDFYIYKDTENCYLIRTMGAPNVSYVFNAAGLRDLLLKEGETSRRYPISYTPINDGGKELFLLINPRSRKTTGGTKG